MAQYSEDMEWYVGEIASLDADEGVCTVAYDGYDEQEEHTLDSLRPLVFPFRFFDSFYSVYTIFIRYNCAILYCYGVWEGGWCHLISSTLHIYIYIHIHQYNR